MRDLVVTENITLDGVIDAAGGWFQPADGNEDLSDLEAALRRQREAADGLLLGRVTFEQISETLREPGWAHTTVIRSVEEIRALKSETGGAIVTTGSITLVRPLIAAGLVDEYRLYTIRSCAGVADDYLPMQPVRRACVLWSARDSVAGSCSRATGRPQTKETRHDDTA